MSKDYIWYLTDLAKVQKNGYKVFTTFSCGGGSSMGYKLAGYEVVGNCEIDPAINEMYVKNHHPKYNFLMGVQDFYKEENRKNIPDELYNVDVLDGSPPCFAAGTKVKTSNGYKNIEDIQVGDLVLTHKGRYRKVTALMSKFAENVCRVRFLGREPITVTLNHPFYCREGSTIDDVSILGEPIWKAIGDMRTDWNDYAAIVTDGVNDVAEWSWYSYDGQYVSEKYVWVPLKEKEKAEPCQVYNISVEEDESYTVEDIAVHNCSLFSMAGVREDGWGKLKHFREGQAEQILDDLFFEYLNIVELLKPKVCVAENVKGLVAGNAKGYVNLIFKRFKELGYDTQLFLLNSANMGVPQKRERVFFVARRQDLGLAPIKLEFHEKPITYGEFADTQYKPLNQTTMEYKRWLKRSPQDDSIGDTVKRTERGKLSGFTSPYLKKNRVPNTLTAGGGMVRFDVPGKPSDKDVITIQTFPQDYDFCKNDPTYVCGMSVPPLMMRGVAREVQRQLLDKIDK